MAFPKAKPKDLPIFISCSTKDIEIARLIRDVIKQLPRFWGYIARDEPKQFEYPSEKIAGILEVCPAFIILYTPSATQSPMTNQEFGFFYHRHRSERGRSPILLIKSTEIGGEIEGFAYGREPIWFTPTFPKGMLCQLLWELKDMFPIDVLEIKCNDHVVLVNWPPVEDCESAIKFHLPLSTTCNICEKEVKLDPYTLMPTE